MESNSIRIVYMGTPGFAVAPLKKLLAEGSNVVGVITAPDKPAGRGKKIRFSPVKQFMLDQAPEIPILQPSNLKDPDFVAALTGLHPDLQVVVAFRMLPEQVWRIPGRGTFNLHASLLPQYRGAAPIHHAIINGEKETGVTTFMIDEQIDTGSLLLQKKTAIGETETAGELHDRLMELGADLVLETVRQLAGGSVKAISQEIFIKKNEVLRTAPKIDNEFCRIQWNRPGREIQNHIRGLSPSPAAYTYLQSPAGKQTLFKVFLSSFEPSGQEALPGTIQTDRRRFLKVSVTDGTIIIHSIQQEGKRRMDTASFLAGFNWFSGPARFF